MKNVKNIGNKTNKVGTSDMPDLKIDIDISVGAVNEYAKSILGRYPKNNIEFSTALQAKVLEEAKCLQVHLRSKKDERYRHNYRRCKSS